VTAVVLLGDIVERPTQRYLVTEVLNMWEVSMGGSHSFIDFDYVTINHFSTFNVVFYYSITSKQLLHNLCVLNIRLVSIIRTNIDSSMLIIYLLTRPVLF
jgi:hypothetical protein